MHGGIRWRIKLTYMLDGNVKAKPTALYWDRKSEQSSVPPTARESKLRKDVNVAEQIGLKMAKTKRLEAQRALKRNSLRKDNPHIHILTHFTHSWVIFLLDFFFFQPVVVKPQLPDCPHSSHQHLLIQLDPLDWDSDAYNFQRWKLYTEPSLLIKKSWHTPPPSLERMPRTLSTSIGTCAPSGTPTGTLTLMAGVWVAVVCE